MFPVPLAVKRLRNLATLNGRAIICLRSMDKAHPTPVTTDPFRLEELGMKQRLRYIIAWKLCTSMKVNDVTDTLDLALAASGCDKVKVEHRPRLLSDNGPCYVASDLGKWLERFNIDQVHGAPGHPQKQGKIERWHQTLKNRILLENYFFQEDLEAQIAAFVEHYNHRRYHESLENLTPADVYFGRGQTILLERERIKRDTIKQRRLNHQAKAA
jgi:transposase InsO family protein